MNNMIFHNNTGHREVPFAYCLLSDSIQHQHIKVEFCYPQGETPRAKGRKIIQIYEYIDVCNETKGTLDNVWQEISHWPDNSSHPKWSFHMVI